MSSSIDLTPPSDSPYRPKENLSKEELLEHLQSLETTPEHIEITLNTLKMLYYHKYLLSYNEYSIGELRGLLKIFAKPLTAKQKKEMRRENKKLAKMKKASHDRLLLAQAAMRKRKEEEKKRAILNLPDKKLVSLLEDVGGKRDRIGYTKNVILQLRDSSEYLSDGEEDFEALEDDTEQDKTLEVLKSDRSKDQIQKDLIEKRVGIHTRNEDLSLHKKGASEEILRTEDVAERSGLVLPKPGNTSTSDTNTNNTTITTTTEQSTSPSPTSDDVQVEKDEPKKLRRPRRCYCCKQPYETVHFFYDSMCQKCGDKNYDKRNQLGDLKGMIALVTGARVKIGYHTVLRLLRSGAQVIATTRFPKDAARRYALEKDYADWKDNLVVYGLDLRHIPSVHEFCDFIKEKYGRLDILINNASQTLKRKPNFYLHLLPLEAKPLNELPQHIQSTVGQDWTMDFGDVMHTALEHQEQEVISQESAEEKRLRLTAPIPNIVAARQRFPHLSQSALMCQVGVVAPADIDPDNHPEGAIDLNGEQIDYSEKNSWVAAIDDVDFVEFMEVQTINMTAPWILIKELKPIMRKPITGNAASYVINVSACEGKFYRRAKTPYHPHTNMSKASMNMLTRTIGQKCAIDDNIFVVSVDTGFNSNELPVKGTLLAPTVPLDEEDGAARILDPIFTGEKTGERMHSQFLKDYRISYW